MSRTEIKKLQYALLDCADRAVSATEAVRGAAEYVRRCPELDKNADILAKLQCAADHTLAIEKIVHAAFGGLGSTLRAEAEREDEE